ncbi:hypothetical protein FGIG_08810 [Fasciola gigantica]|uniref:Uncharacterized protein n=1 Tax=Fasciola gigantica TaxID=46835 RepID=A0A504Z2Y6_FASGI|nr:hypothetical protein FGIG_08810 [Fasciola gigantica]
MSYRFCSTSTSPPPILSSISPIELVTDNAKTSPTARPSQKNVSKLVSLFETGGKLPLPGSMKDNGDRNQNQSHPQLPLTTNAISAPTDGKRLVPERDSSAPGSASPSTDFGDVVLRLKDIENKYERRQPYKSIFINAPL